MQTALGLMSGTSMDGIDAAVIKTDGRRGIAYGPHATLAYDQEMRKLLRGVLGGRGDVEMVERELTEMHGAFVNAFLRNNDLAADEIDVIGFHGHTVLHRPDQGLTWQIGEGARLAALTGIDVVNDFRSADVAGGGEGAPLAPLYQAALAAELERPLAVLNIGGVANATWLGVEFDVGESIPNASEILAFDTGPGNAPIDDAVRALFSGHFDEDGELARVGKVDEALLARMLENDYFDRPPPKSLDREDFNDPAGDERDAHDQIATLTAFTARAAARAAEHFPAPVKRWLVTGGGRHNWTLMNFLRDALPVPVEAVEAVGWNGDALEAQAFAYLAVRSLKGLALSLPTTTGVAQPISGGQLHSATAIDGG